MSELPSTMTSSQNQQQALFEIYLATAEKVSERRAQTNAYLLSVNSALVALYGYLPEGQAGAVAVDQAVWHWAIPTAGAIVCIAWVILLLSYHSLNRAKFAVLTEMEAVMAIQVFSREREIYKQRRRLPLAKIESAIPWCFILLYAAMTSATLLKP